MATIAFLGLGNMGGPMAKNLLAAGHALTVFDLVEAACAAVAAEGASIAASAAEAAEGADVIISMLPAGKHVAGTFLGEDGLLAKVSTDTLILDASTIDAATARQVGEAAAELGIDFMDTPVSGGVAAAAGLFIRQQIRVRDRSEKACFSAFLNNNWVGLAVFAGLLGHYAWLAYG